MPGVYISYPFCRQKCTFCNFASEVYSRALEARYVAALRAEIQRHPWRWQPETLYLGGGTPGDIDPAVLETILALVPGYPWGEATVEAAPGSITRKKAHEWRRLGINRISLGVQTFVRAEIARTGRRHTAEIVRDEIELLRDEGITNFNIDLIAGLPGQTPESWSESLDWIERLRPPHVSVYMLEIDDDSRLGREMRRGGSRYGAPDAPSEETTVTLYEMAVERLQAAGIERYEISNFAVPGHESRHNLKYWRIEPYVGFGADSHSFDGEIRRQNAETASEYVTRTERSESPCIAESPAKPDEERFYVGLRQTAGIRLHPDDWQRFETTIRRFADQGLVEAKGDTLRLTPRGILFSNEVLQEFIGT
ncbi:MAG: radical SAM family heme chaperone HemW [Bryobacteraceae bacterium]